MRSLIYAIALGLLGAAMVHIIVVLLIPSYSQNDAWTRLGNLSADNEFNVIERNKPTNKDTRLQSIDPLFLIAACRFNLSNGPVQITQKGTVPFWSISVFDRYGQNFFSLNDHNASDRQLDIALATPLQMVELRKELPEQLTKSIFIETKSQQGLVVLRSFIPDLSWQTTIEKFVSQAHCKPIKTR